MESNDLRRALARAEWLPGRQGSDSIELRAFPTDSKRGGFDVTLPERVTRDPVCAEWGQARKWRRVPNELNDQGAGAVYWD
jgi:hypothetical protein